MEVHHHPDLHHKKKKFKEYFLEFLMIFLAVTLGFFAENLREHIVTNEKGKQYLERLAVDLKKDTAEINIITGWQQVLIEDINKVLKIDPDSIYEPANQQAFYSNLIYFYSWVPVFLRTENTITQLKSAGGFAVINNHALVDSLGRLDNYYDRIKYNNDWYIKSVQSMENTTDEFVIIHKIPNDFYDSSSTMLPSGTKIFSNNDRRLSAKLYNEIRVEQSMLYLLVDMEKEYKKKSVDLLGLLKD